MGDGSVGSSNHFVRPAGVVERAESVTDRRPRREPQRQQQDAADRRRKEPPNPRRRRVYDLLFDEVDKLDSLSEQQRARVKENIRNHVVGAAPSAEPPAGPPPGADEPPPAPDAGHDETHTAEQLLADPQAEVPVDHDHIVSVAAPVRPHQPLTEAEENRLLAEQLRVCLAQHSGRARKLAVYLHVLLSMHQGVRPTLVLDI